MTVVSAAIDRVVGLVILRMQATYQMGCNTATPYQDWFRFYTERRRSYTLLHGKNRKDKPI